MPCEVDKTALPDPSCAACKQSWPIHVDSNTGKRYHIDLFYTYEAGCIVDCPTEYWIEESDDEPESEASNVHRG